MEGVARDAHKAYTVDLHPFTNSSETRALSFLASHTIAAEKMMEAADRNVLPWNPL